MRSVGADVLERACVAIVGVDAADLSTIASCGALDVNVALALAGALFEEGQQLKVSRHVDQVGTGVAMGFLRFHTTGRLFHNHLRKS